MNWYLWYLEVLRNYHMIHQTFGDSLNQGARQASCGGSLSGDTKHMHKTPWKGKLSKPNVFGAPPILRCPYVRPDGISIWWSCWIMSTIPNSRRRVPGRFFQINHTFLTLKPIKRLESLRIFLFFHPPDLQGHHHFPWRLSAGEYHEKRGRFQEVKAAKVETARLPMLQRFTFHQRSQKH